MTDPENNVTAVRALIDSMNDFKIACFSINNASSFQIGLHRQYFVALFLFLTFALGRFSLDISLTNPLLHLSNMQVTYEHA